MLVVSNLTKRYGKTMACDHVSFMLEPGTVTVLLGPNGAGKSTAMKSIIGFLKYEGSVAVDDFDNHSIEAKRLLGFVPEMPSLYPNLTVSEHMEFLARAYQLKDYKERMEELLDRFELTDKKRKYGDELSKGMQQKLNICLGLLPQPKILMLDEPMVGLDPHAIKELKTVIAELRDSGCAVLVSTHMIDSVDTFWDHAIIMQKGQIRATVSRRDLDAKGESLEQLFFDLTEEPTAGDAQ